MIYNLKGPGWNEVTEIKGKVFNESYTKDIELASGVGEPVGEVAVNTVKTREDLTFRTLAGDKLYMKIRGASETDEVKVSVVNFNDPGEGNVDGFTPELEQTIHDNKDKIQNLSSDGNNVYIADDTGKQSLMVKIPRFKISDVMTVPAEDDGWHPAFIVNGEIKDCIYISKYQNVVENNRAYSLGGEDPRAYINFDQAKLACEAKGQGWHLMTNAEWAAISLWCKKNETEPLGNNNAGSHYSKKYLCGAESYIWKLSYDWGGRSHKEEPIGTYWHTGRIETGSGPKEFSHTHGLDGIFDLNGNVREWVGGMRLKNGEIQVILDNDAAITATDMSSTSIEWKAILQDGSYVTPGTADTLKIDNTTPNGGSTGNVGGDPVLNVIRENQMADEDTDGYLGYSDVAFKDFGSKVTVPNILKQLGIAPDGNIGGDRLYVRNYGERLPIRGGYWFSTSGAGVFTLYLNYARAGSSGSIGFRSAFVF